MAFPNRAEVVKVCHWAICQRTEKIPQRKAVEGSAVVSVIVNRRGKKCGDMLKTVEEIAKEGIGRNYRNSQRKKAAQMAGANVAWGSEKKTDGRHLQLPPSPVNRGPAKTQE